MAHNGYYTESSNVDNVNELLDQAEFYKGQSLEYSLDSATSAALSGTYKDQAEAAAANSSTAAGDSATSVVAASGFADNAASSANSASASGAAAAASASAASIAEIAAEAAQAAAEAARVGAEAAEDAAVAASVNALLKSNNLSDLPSKPTARTNLDVYSKSEGDSRYGRLASTNSWTADQFLGGSLTFSGSSRRITGDFSSSVGSYANRTLFQSSVTNGSTLLTTVPNGTSTVSGAQFFSTPSLEQCQRLETYCTATNAVIASTRSGAAGYVPLELQAGGGTRLTLGTDGLVTVANDFADSGGLTVFSTLAGNIKRTLRVMHADASLQYLNNAQSATTHVFYDNGNLWSVGDNSDFGSYGRVKSSTALSVRQVDLLDRISNTGVRYFYDTSNGNRGLAPTSDNNTSLGGTISRWTTVFATTGTINTSDAREKTTLVDFSEEEIKVAEELVDQVGVYQWLDALEKKGESARLHVGPTVQKVIEVFAKYGLDPMRYAVVCYDEWEASGDTPAGNRYGLRYDQLAQFMLKGQASKQKKLEARLTALEALLST